MRKELPARVLPIFFRWAPRQWCNIRFNKHSLHSETSFREGKYVLRSHICARGHGAPFHCYRREPSRRAWSGVRGKDVHSRANREAAAFRPGRGSGLTLVDDLVSSSFSSPSDGKLYAGAKHSIRGGAVSFGPACLLWWFGSHPRFLPGPPSLYVS